MTGINPFDFRRFRKNANNRTGGNSVTVTGENDLAETFVYAWIDSLTPATGTTPIEADVYLSGPTNLIPWTQATKGQHLHYGEYDYETYPYRMKYETTLGTLTSSNLSYSRTFYVEADTQNWAYSGEISANVSFVNSYGAPGYDSVRYTPIAADIDVDSNNDGSINSTDDPIEMDGYGCLVLAGQSFSVEFSSIFTSQIDWDEYGLSFISSNTDVLDSFSIVDAAACFTNSGSVNFRNLTTKNASGETTLTFQIVDKSTSNVVASDSVVITVFTIGVDMAFNHNRLNNIGADGINIRADGSDNKEIHAPELQMNAPGTGESWTSPNGGIGSMEVLYIADSNVTVYTRFVTSLAVSGGFTLDLQATASDASIEGLGVETITFDANGYSTGGSTIAGVAGFIEFTASKSTASAVSKEVSTFDWNVTKINAKTNGTGKALTTEAVTFYTVLDVPNDPWNPIDTLDTTLPEYQYYPYDATDNKMQPWVTVLETLTSSAWCDGNTTVEQLASTITTNLYQGGKFRYEPSGPPVYLVFPDLPYFNLSSFHNQLKSSPGTSATTVGCADIAYGVKILSNLLGDNLNVMHIGFATGTFDTKRINPIGSTPGSPDWVIKQGWGYHAVAWRGADSDTGTVYDACLKLDDGSTDGILAINMAFTSYRSMLTNDTIGRQGFRSISRLD